MLLTNKLVIAVAAWVAILASCSKPPSETAPQPAQSASPASTLPLIGYVDVPPEGAVLQGEFGVGGWALWGEKVATIQVLLDGAPAGTAPQLRIARPDVAKVHPEYQDANSGWGSIKLDTSAYAPGAHRITVSAVSVTGKTQEIRTFNVTFKKSN